MTHQMEDLLRACLHGVVVAREGAGGLEILCWRGDARTLFGRDGASMTGERLASLFPADSDCPARAAACLAAGSACEMPDVPIAHAGGDDRTADVCCESLPGGALLLIAFRDRARAQEALDVVRYDHRAAFEAVTARLAHEVRNPLGSVLLNLALLRETLPAAAASGAAIDPDVVLAAAESQIERIQVVLRQYVDAVRGVSAPAEIFADVAELLA